MSAPVIAPGAHIEVRDAVWRVIKGERTLSGTHAWEVIGVSEVVRDEPAIFLEDYEDEIRVLDPRTTALVADSSAGHTDSLLYLESLLRDVPPTTPDLYVGHQAALDVMDFQLEPAAKALAQPRQRILIADAVGLGKTLEAGIVLSELIARGRGQRILVATVKSMLTQFQKELWCRFAIPLVRLDSVGLHRIRQHLPSDANPFYHFNRVIISVDTLKQHNAFRAHLEAAEWDVVVIDEAHNVARRGSGSALRHGIAKVLARRCDAMVMLSATPHDGKAESFASLMNMLDPTAIADPKNYTRADIDGLFVRRFKADVAAQLGKGFPEPSVAEGIAAASPAEEAAYDALVALDFTRLDQHQTGHLLFKSTLTKALFSSPAACRETIRNRLKRLATHDDAPAFADDIAQLHRLDAALAAISPAEQSKYSKLLQVIGDKAQGLGWTGRDKADRLVLFSERIETLHFLHQRLQADLGLKPEQIALLHGGLPDVEQQRLVEEFGQESAKVRLLLASDVASEGLNLHYLCHKLVHYDLPWSLMVFQQRNGRVDRYGQTRPPQIVYLQTRSTNAAIADDLAVLNALKERASRARENIDDPFAFAGVFDIDEQERMTEEAMRKGLAASRLGQGLARQGVMNPLEAMLRAKASQGLAPATPTVRRLTRPSLFRSHTAYVRKTLEWLTERKQLQGYEALDHGRILRFAVPTDLLRRYRALPPEALPDDHRLMLTADADAMQQAIVDARGEETAWPALQFLWPLHPVVSWCADKARGAFGRHAAPVLSLHHGLQPDQAVVLLSGLLPNQRAQPLVHAWFAAHFTAGTFTRLEPFEDLTARLQLGHVDLPNWQPALDLTALSALIAPAVHAAEQAMTERRAAFLSATEPRLQAELHRLAALRQRQEHQLDLDFPGSSTAAHATRDARARDIRRTFHDYETWIKTSMTTESTPFLQVLAVLRPEGGFGGAK